MKRIILIIVSVIVISAIAFSQGSQTNKSVPQDKSSVKINQSSTGSAQTNTGYKPNEYERGKDLEFANEASSASLMEIQLGKLAQQKGRSPQVKSFGSMMVRDHTDASNKLKSTMQNLGVPVTTSMLQKHEDKLEELGEKTGADFDKAYVDLMVKDHREDVSKFENAVSNIQEPSLKQWTNNTLSVMKKHLVEAEKLQAQIR